MSVLATFNISKSEARDEGLRDAEPAVGYAGGHVRLVLLLLNRIWLYKALPCYLPSLPPSFNCTIVPRNGNVTDLIHGAAKL